MDALSASKCFILPRSIASDSVSGPCDVVMVVVVDVVVVEVVVVMVAVVVVEVVVVTVVTVVVDDVAAEVEVVVVIVVELAVVVEEGANDPFNVEKATSTSKLGFWR